MTRLHGAGCVWKELVFIASLWAKWTIHQAWATLLIEKIPEVPQAGQDVLLSVHGVSGAIQDFNWYQGEETDGSTMIFSYIPGLPRPQRNGNAMMGRNIIGFPNGSLLLRQAQPKDSGTYQVGITINPYWLMRAKTELQIIEKALNATSTVHTSPDPEKDKSSPMSSGTTVAIVVGCLGFGALVVGSGLVYLLVTRSRRIKSSGVTAAKPDAGHMCLKHRADSSNIYEVIHSPIILQTPSDKGSNSANLTSMPQTRNQEAEDHRYQSDRVLRLEKSRHQSLKGL